MRRGITSLLIPALALVPAACTGDDGAAVTTTSAPIAPSAPTSTVPVDDGVLRIGLLTPLTGDGAELGLSLRAGVELAVTEINEAGGVNGQPVQLRVADEGPDNATAAAGVDELLRDQVDAIVGPASNNVTLSVLDTIRRARVLACSPTATAIALDDFPDDGLFFRTVPSDTLQAEAIARTVEGTGRSSVGVLYVDDAYGRRFADRLQAALATRPIETLAMPFAASATEQSTAAAIAAVADRQVLVVLGDAANGARMVSALVEAAPADGTPIIVNDAMRGDPAATTFAELPSSALSRIMGVAPRALIDNPEFVDALAEIEPDAAGLFAVNAFDCVHVIALAAAAAGASDPRSIAARIPNVAAGGSRCTRFEDCVTAIHEGRNVDYDGPSGGLQLGSDGDTNRASYDLFRFTSTGTELSEGTQIVAV